MLDDIRKTAETLIDGVKRKVYGKTFACPVCHLELSYHDVDKDGLVVCPLCGVVIELADVFGHPLPVVHEVAIKRHQPTLRLHPLSTHLPIGLYPLALFLAGIIVLISVMYWFAGELPPVDVPGFRTLNRVTAFLLVLSVASSALTFATGLWDWYRRYEKRRYRVITLKIWFSGIFLMLGALTSALHLSGLVFDGASGLVSFTPLSTAMLGLYGLLGAANLIVLATLGHVGGLLVLGE